MSQQRSEADIRMRIEELDVLQRQSADFERVEPAALILLSEPQVLSSPELQVKVLSLLSRSLWMRSREREALSYALRALEVSEAGGSIGDRVWVLADLGTIYQRLDDYEQSLSYHQQALSLAEQSHDQRAAATIVGNIGIVHYQRGVFSDALRYFFQSLHQHQQLGNSDAVGLNMGNIGNVYLQLGQCDKALENYRQAIAIHEEFGQDARVANVRVNMSSAYARLGFIDQALECLTMAMADHERLGNVAAVANDISGIATLNVKLGRFEKSIEYFKKAIALQESSISGSHSRTAVMYAGFGSAYASMHRYDEALEMFDVALRMYQERESQSGVLGINTNIADVYIDIGRYDEARVLLHAALLHARDVEDVMRIAGILSSLGQLCITKDYADSDHVFAERCLLEAKEIYEVNGTHIDSLGTLLSLATLYGETGRGMEAYSTLKQYHELRDRVQSEEARSKADLMEQSQRLNEQEKRHAAEQAAQHAAATATTTLLYKVLPVSIATRLMNNEKVADYFESVSILFADIVGFTPIAARMQAGDVLSLLNFVFGEFDRIMEKHSCQKIKTMGDGYMAVCGAPIPCDDHAERLANAALDLLNDIELPESLRSSLPKGSVFHLRIGLHCGPAFAGIVGEKGFVYDVYSDAVNLASRMESHGEPGKIHCSEEFKNHLGPRLHALRFAERGEIEIKGKGTMRTHFLEKA